MNEEPTERLRRYVENMGRGMDSFPAAKAAGYSDSYARVAAHRLGGKPAVAQAIATIRKEGMQAAIYDLSVAMKEAEAVCDFAIKHKNAMAYCKGTELRAKLSGLLIDRVEVVQVDLRGSLERAEKRVLNVTPSNGASSPAALLPSPAKTAIRWGAAIAGDRVAEEPKAGSADGQAKNSV